MLSTLFKQLGSHINAELNEDMLRHMILNSIRYNKKKFEKEFGELIICSDDRNYWRKDFFPYYKAARKKIQQDSELDWNLLFTSLNKIRSELDEYFPYKFIKINKTEADDIIGTIVHHEGTMLNDGKPILILSSDKDFIQLHQYGNVKQYSPIQKKYLTDSNPSRYLLNHIIRGDIGDGIPNILSPDDTFVMNKRQKTITQKRMIRLQQLDFTSEEKRNFDRNSKLIDLKNVPEDLKIQILNKYYEPNKKDRKKIYKYLIHNKLKYLLENLNDF